MYFLALTSTHQQAFQTVKEIVFAQPTSRVSQQQPPKKEKAKDEPKVTTLTCRGCNWVGKDTEARSEVFFLEHTTELELYCPKCHSYLGFQK